MPVGAFVPSRIHLDYPEWQAPLIGNIGQVWAYTGSGYAPVALDFDPAGTAAAAVADHVGLPNPHSQYYLASGVSGFGATLASAADAAAARTALALGTAALYNVGTSANNIVQLDGSARLPAVDGSQLTGISGGSVAGSNTQVIFNDSGVYAGDPGLTYTKATDRLTVVGGIIAGDWSPPSDSTTAVSIWNSARSARVVTVDTTNYRTYFSYGTGGATPTDGIMIVRESPNISGRSTMALKGTNWGGSSRIVFENHISTVRFNCGVTFNSAIAINSLWLGASDTNQVEDVLLCNADSSQVRLTAMKYASSPYPEVIMSARQIVFRTATAAAWPDGSGGAVYGTQRLLIDDDGIDVTGTIHGDGLRLDVTPTSETITPTHTITISLNGTNYKIPCVAA